MTLRKSNQINFLVEIIVVPVRVLCDFHILRDIVSLNRQR